MAPGINVKELAQQWEKKLLFIVLIAMIIILFAFCVTYDDPAGATERLVRYPYFQDVNVMIFVGFGFLMSFMAHGGFTATSHAFFVAVFALLWAVLNRGFFAHRLSLRSF